MFQALRRSWISYDRAFGTFLDLRNQAWIEVVVMLMCYKYGICVRKAASPNIHWIYYERLRGGFYEHSCIMVEPHEENGIFFRGLFNWHNLIPHISY